MDRAALLTGGGLALSGVVLLAMGMTDVGILCIALCGLPYGGYSCLHSLRPLPSKARFTLPPSTGPLPVTIVVEEDPRAM